MAISLRSWAAQPSSRRRFPSWPPPRAFPLRSYSSAAPLSHLAAHPNTGTLGSLVPERPPTFIPKRSHSRRRVRSPPSLAHGIQNVAVLLRLGAQALLLGGLHQQDVQVGGEIQRELGSHAALPHGLAPVGWPGQTFPGTPGKLGAHVFSEEPQPETPASRASAVGGRSWAGSRERLGSHQEQSPEDGQKPRGMVQA